MLMSTRNFPARNDHQPSTMSSEFYFEGDSSSGDYFPNEIYEVSRFYSNIVQRPPTNLISKTETKNSHQRQISECPVENDDNGVPSQQSSFSSSSNSLRAQLAHQLVSNPEDDEELALRSQSRLANRETLQRLRSANGQSAPTYQRSPTSSTASLRQTNAPNPTANQTDTVIVPDTMEIGISDMNRLRELVPAAVAERRAKEAKYSVGDKIAYTTNSTFEWPTGELPVLIGATVVQWNNKIVVHGGLDLKDSLLEVKRTRLRNKQLGQTSISWNQLVVGNQQICSSGMAHMFDLDSKTGWQRMTKFLTEPLAGHSSVEYDNKIWIYGGVGNGPSSRSLFSEVYVYDCETSQSIILETSKPKPPGRSNHTAIMYDHFMIVYGGHSQRSTVNVHGDLWALNLLEGVWTRLPMTVHPSSDSFSYIHGDSDACRDKGLLFEKCNEGQDGPGMRYGHACALWNDYMFICLGRVGCECRTDMWAYSLREKVWIQVEPLGVQLDVRFDFGSTVIGTKWIIHGGFDVSGRFSNTIFEFDFVTHESRLLRIGHSSSDYKLNRDCRDDLSLSSSEGHCLQTSSPDFQPRVGSSVIQSASVSSGCAYHKLLSLSNSKSFILLNGLDESFISFVVDHASNPSHQQEPRSGSPKDGIDWKTLITYCNNISGRVVKQTGEGRSKHRYPSVVIPKLENEFLKKNRVIGNNNHPESENRKNDQMNSTSSRSINKQQDNKQKFVQSDELTSSADDGRRISFEDSISRDCSNEDMNCRNDFNRCRNSKQQVSRSCPMTSAIANGKLSPTRGHELPNSHRSQYSNISHNVRRILEQGIGEVEESPRYWSQEDNTDRRRQDEDNDKENIRRQQTSSTKPSESYLTAAEKKAVLAEMNTIRNSLRILEDILR